MTPDGHHPSVAEAGRSASFEALVGAIRAALAVPAGAGGPAAAAAAAAGALRPHLGAPDLLPATACDPGPGGSRETVLHVEPGGRFSVVALAWAPGVATPPHDHRAWVVVGVHRGAERTSHYAWSLAQERLVHAGEREARAGDVDVFVPPGDVHRVVCAGQTPAVSLHVYGVDVTRGGSGVRRLYAPPADAPPADAPPADAPPADAPPPPGPAVP